MARMRTLKPEFWNSPSTGHADLAPRLTFMAMWNWADDSGHGTANLKELEAFVFPHDNVSELPRRGRANSAGSTGGWRSFAEVCGEVAEAYGVIFYMVRGRPFYQIPNFKEHQSKDFKPKSRYPSVSEGEIYDVTSGLAISDTVQVSADVPQFSPSAAISGGSSANSGLVIGEQGKRVTGEQGNSSSSEVAIATRPEYESLLDLLDSLIVQNGSKKPSRTKQNVNAIRLLVEKDGRTVEQVERAIRWCQQDEFWRGNILSASKLRTQYDKLRLAAERDRKNGASVFTPNQERALGLVDEYREEESQRGEITDG